MAVPAGHSPGRLLFGRASHPNAAPAMLIVACCASTMSATIRSDMPASAATALPPAVIGTNCQRDTVVWMIWRTAGGSLSRTCTAYLQAPPSGFTASAPVTSMLPTTCGCAAKPRAGMSRLNIEQATRFIATPRCRFGRYAMALLPHDKHAADVQAVRNGSAQPLGRVMAHHRAGAYAPVGAGGRGHAL